MRNQQISQKRLLFTVLGTVAAVLMNSVNSLRLGFLSDIHLNPSYDGKCQFVSCADQGNYGTDTPQFLLDSLLDDMVAGFHDY